MCTYLRLANPVMNYAWGSFDAIHALLGDIDAGKAEIQLALELAPWLSIQANESSTFFQNQRDLERFTSVLRTLGLPE